jgi:hypothetical protein
MRVWLLATLLTMGLPANAEAQDGSASPHPQSRRSHSIETLNGFVENRGQWPDEVLFVAGLDGIEATLLRDGLVLRPLRADAPPANGADLVGVTAPPLCLRWPAAVLVQGESTLPTAHHFFLGHRSASFVPGFERVVYRQVSPGVDLVVRTGSEGFVYDLHVAPGAALEGLVIAAEGVDCAELLNDGVMALHTAAGVVEHRIGESWQIDAQRGETRPVAARFRLVGSGPDSLSFGFEAPGRDASTSLVIDPSLVYGTYVGGGAAEHVEDMHVSPDGSVYLAVRASTGGSPTTPGAFQELSPGGANAWAGKLSPDGSTLEWATFVGGAATEVAVGVHVDDDGTVVVTGRTHSTDFPVTPGCLQAAKSGNSDLFAVRLSADGSQLLWGTYYGGTDSDFEGTSALTPSGDVLLAFEPGALFGMPPPATPGAFDTVFDPFEQMLACISADGTELVFATYFSSAMIHHITFDAQSNILFTGRVFPNEILVPTTLGVLKESLAPGDNGDSFIAKLVPSGSQLLWATYFGGDEGSADGIAGIAVDPAGAIYVAGSTDSDDFPVTAGAFDSQLAPSVTGGYVAKLLPNATGLVWSTLISACCGGVSSQKGLVVDSAGNPIAVGSSSEPNYPVTPDAFQPNFVGGPGSSGDAHITKFDAFGETLVYSTYFGGNGGESCELAGLDAGQHLYFALDEGSTDLPATPAAYDQTYNGGFDTFVAKFSLPLAPWLVLAGGTIGAVDVPNLAGRGALTPGTPARLSVRGAAASAPASIIVGLTAANLPFKGGTLVPTPTLIVPLATNVQGALDLPFTWVSVPAGINLFVQVWIKDPGAPNGFSATNALRMTSQ